MTEPAKAVFLSYASQDAETARRICEALRAGRIEVWFDQRHGREGYSASSADNAAPGDPGAVRARGRAR
jgi:hypothetical protein